MQTVFAHGNFWQLIRHSDVVTWMVLLLLFAMSVFCWTVFLYKMLLGRVKSRQVDAVAQRMQQANSLDDVLAITAHNASTLPGFLLSTLLTNLKALLVISDARKQALGQKDWEVLEQRTQRTHDELMYHEDRAIPLVSVCASIAPLLGLFGTVWGLVNAFLGISHQQSADISAVAPGIAQALITTVAGLIVAIPGLAIYTYLTMQSQALEQRLFDISQRFMWIAQQVFDSKKES